MSLVLATLGYLLLAIAYIFDKFILSKSVSRPIVYTFYSTVFLLGAFILVPFGVEPLARGDWQWAIVSGFSFGLALWAIFFALRHGEATHVNPFNGAVITVATYALSTWVFSEQLTTEQKLGVFFLVIACLLLSWQKTRGKNHVGVSLFWASVSGVLFAVSHVSAKYLYEFYPFLTGFVWSRAAIGVFGVLLLFHPAVRRVFSGRHREMPKTEAKRHAFSLIVVGKTFAVISAVCLQYAIALGSATIVNALAGLQFFFMFVIIYLLTKFHPRVFQEYFTKKEIAFELLAIFFILLGSAVIVF